MCASINTKVNLSDSLGRHRKLNVSSNDLPFLAGFAVGLVPEPFVAVDKEETIISTTLTPF